MTRPVPPGAPRAPAWSNALAGIQVKRKLRDVIEKQLEADKTPPASLPRAWQGVLWEQISDELSSFFSNTDGLPGAPSAKALLVRAVRMRVFACVVFDV